MSSTSNTYAKPDAFPQMVDIYGEKFLYGEIEKRGDFSLRMITLTSNMIALEKTRAIINGNYDEVLGLKSGDYMMLRNDKIDEVVMSDTGMERRTNYDFVKRAHGKVLVGGLGIGMILLALQDKECVSEITVVEKNKDVYHLIYPYLKKHLNKKVVIVIDDVYEYHRKATGVVWDSIYFDIWNNISGDNYPEMQKLTKDYFPLLRPSSDSFISCWREDDCRVLL